MVSEHERGRPGRPLNAKRLENSGAGTGSYQLRNSLLHVEGSKEGPIARIVRPQGIDEWAGPLPEETVAALREVAENA